MKDKIFKRLKQEYAHLGLDDTFLLGLAESLANSGFVTDENIEGVVSAQKAYLESMQKSNDKRVQEAVDKAKKAAQEEQSAKIADLEKQLEEAKSKQTPPPPVDNNIPEWYKAKEKEREEKEAAYQNQIDELKKQRKRQTARSPKLRPHGSQHSVLNPSTTRQRKRESPTISSSAVSARFQLMPTMQRLTRICRSTPKNSRPTSFLARTVSHRATEIRQTRPRPTPWWENCSRTAKKRRIKTIV